MAVRADPFAVALAAALATWYLSSDGVYTRWNLVTWAVALACWIWALWPPGVGTTASRMWNQGRTRSFAWTALAVLLIVAVGVFFRFHQLAQVPKEPTSDHAEKLLDVADVRAGLHPVFFPRNTGREPLQFYATAAIVDAGAAPTFQTLKLGTAFVGALGVVGVLLLAWEFAGRAAGLLAAAFFAVAMWPVSLAPDGLRHTYAITASAFALWLLLRYLRTRSRADLLLCGVALGVGLHGYTAFRVVPAFAVVVVAAASFRSGRRMLAEVGILLGTVTVATLPLLRYAIDHPDLVWYRTVRRVGGAEAPVGGLADAARTFASNTWNAALAFNWRGDSSPVGLVEFDPFLDVIAGAGFLAGLLLLGERVVRHSDAPAVALAAALPLLSLSSVLNLSFPTENPSAARMGPVAPVVFTVASLAPAYVLARVATLPRQRLTRGVTAVLVAGALVVSAVDGYARYFRDFDRQYRAFIPNASEAVAAIRATGVPPERVFMLPYDFWIDARNVGVELGNIGWWSSNVVQPGQPLPMAEGRRLAFLLNASDDGGRSRLAEEYPGGSYRRVPSEVGKDFAVFVVPAGALTRATR